MKVIHFFYCLLTKVFFCSNTWKSLTSKETKTPQVAGKPSVLYSWTPISFRCIPDDNKFETFVEDSVFYSKFSSIKIGTFRNQAITSIDTKISGKSSGLCLWISISYGCNVRHTFQQLRCWNLINIVPCDGKKLQIYLIIYCYNIIF